jgi:hypothetical protein
MDVNSSLLAAKKPRTNAGQGKCRANIGAVHKDESCLSNIPAIFLKIFLKRQKA